MICIHTIVWTKIRLRIFDLVALVPNMSHYTLEYTCFQQGWILLHAFSWPEYIAKKCIDALQSAVVSFCVNLGRKLGAYYVSGLVVFGRFKKQQNNFYMDLCTEIFHRLKNRLHSYKWVMECIRYWNFPFWRTRACMRSYFLMSFHSSIFLFNLHPQKRFYFSNHSSIKWIRYFVRNIFQIIKRVCYEKYIYTSTIITVFPFSVPDR